MYVRLYLLYMLLAANTSSSRMDHETVISVVAASSFPWVCGHLLDQSIHLSLLIPRWRRKIWIRFASAWGQGEKSKQERREPICRWHRLSWEYKSRPLYGDKAKLIRLWQSHSLIRAIVSPTANPFVIQFRIIKRLSILTIYSIIADGWVSECFFQSRSDS